MIDRGAAVVMGQREREGKRERKDVEQTRLEMMAK
jgi:hypothetical protein